MKEEGWTKASMGKMKKVDSFMRESLRVNPVSPRTSYLLLFMTVPDFVHFSQVTMGRYMLKPYTFSDGTRVLKGSYVYASSYSANMEEATYERAREFDPWRYIDVKRRM